MTPASPRTVVRSLRLRQPLFDLLERDAAAKGISVNALVTSILTQYAEWDRFAEKFGFVSIARVGYIALLDALSDEKLEEVGERIGRQNPRDMTLFWFKRLGIEPFLAYLNLVSRYSRTARIEVERSGSDVTLLVYHDLNERHSRLLRRLFGAAIHSVVGVVPRSQLGRNSVVFRFRVPSDVPDSVD